MWVKIFLGDVGGDAIASIYETTWDIVDPRAMDQIK